MSLSIKVTPQELMPVYNEIIIVATSSLQTNLNYQLVTDITCRGEAIGQTKQIPNPEGYIVIDLQRHLENKITSDFRPNETGIYKAEGSFASYSVKFSHEYTPEWPFADNFFNAGFVGFVGTQEPDFSIGDEIFINQIAPFSFSQYNGPATITGITQSGATWSITTNKPYVGDAPANPGTMSFAQFTLINKPIPSNQITYDLTVGTDCIEVLFDEVFIGKASKTQWIYNLEPVWTFQYEGETWWIWKDNGSWNIGKGSFYLSSEIEATLGTGSQPVGNWSTGCPPCNTAIMTWDEGSVVLRLGEDGVYSGEVLSGTFSGTEIEMEIVGDIWVITADGSPVANTTEVVGECPPSEGWETPLNDFSLEVTSDCPCDCLNIEFIYEGETISLNIPAIGMTAGRTLYQNYTGMTPSITGYNAQVRWTPSNYWYMMIEKPTGSSASPSYYGTNGYFLYDDVLCPESISWQVDEEYWFTECSIEGCPECLQVSATIDSDVYNFQMTIEDGEYVGTDDGKEFRIFFTSGRWYLAWGEVGELENIAENPNQCPHTPSGGWVFTNGITQLQVRDCNACPPVTTSCQADIVTQLCATPSYPAITNKAFVFNGVRDFVDFPNWNSNDWDTQTTEPKWGKFFTNAPDGWEIEEASSMYLNVWANAVNELRAVRIQTNLGTFTINSPYSTLATDAERFVGVPCGPKQLKERGWIDDTSTWFRIWTQNQVTTQTLQKKEFKIVRKCTRYEKVQLLFRDRMGSFVPYSFIRVSRENRNISRTNYDEVFGKYAPATNNWKYNSWDRGTKSLDTIVTESHTVHSDWVDQKTSDYLMELFSSPEVYWIDETGLTIAVTITNTSVERKKVINDQIINHTIDFQKSTKNRNLR